MAHLGLGVQKTRLRKQAIDHEPQREKTGLCSNFVACEYQRH